MATTGGHLQGMETSPHRTARVLILVLALAAGLLIGGVVGRVTASSGPDGVVGSTTRPFRDSTPVSDSGLTAAERSQLAHQIQVVTSHRMQEWERACSSDQQPAVNVC